MNAPFKFLDAYNQDDIDVFFGRKKETEDLYDALSGVKHLLVYGPSGAGKTSLIECGLRNQFSDADWFALTIRKGANINAAVFARINEALEKPIPINTDTQLPADSNTDFAQVIEKLFAERHQPLYLLFDQFEELLILGEETEKKDFFRRIKQLIQYRVPCRVIFIMREEFIGHLSEFEEIFPTIFQHRFRLEKMPRSNVQLVIESILDAPEYQGTFAVEDSQALAKKMLEKLPSKQKEIELAHVQVFLSELWDKAKENTPDDLPLLHQGLIGEEDKLEGVLDSFLKKQLNDLEKIYGKKTPLEVLAAMISERHTKLQLSVEEIEKDLRTKSISLSTAQLAQLLLDFEKRRILRTLKSDELTQYELSHDILAFIVGQNLTDEMKLREKAADIYAVYQEREGFFSQEDLDYMRPYQVYKNYPADLKKRIEDSETHIANEKATQAAKARRQIMVLSGFLGVVLIALVIAAYYYFDASLNERKANEQTALAIEQRNKADSLRIRSDSMLSKIERQTGIILQEKKNTENALAETEVQRKEAESQKTAAQNNATEAEKQKIEAQTQRKEAERKKKEAEDALNGQKKAEEKEKQAQLQNLETRIEAIRRFIRTGQKQKAIVELQSCLKIAPNNPELLQLEKELK